MYVRRNLARAPTLFDHSGKVVSATRLAGVATMRMVHCPLSFNASGHWMVRGVLGRGL